MDLKCLEAPPGIEPGMEVLQTIRGHFSTLNNSGRFSVFRGKTRPLDTGETMRSMRRKRLDRDSDKDSGAAVREVSAAFDRRVLQTNDDCRRAWVGAENIAAVVVAITRADLQPWLRRALLQLLAEDPRPHWKRYLADRERATRAEDVAFWRQSGGATWEEVFERAATMRGRAKVVRGSVEVLPANISTAAAKKAFYTIHKELANPETHWRPSQIGPEARTVEATAARAIASLRRTKSPQRLSGYRKTRKK